jgi:hypothetical protein
MLGPLHAATLVPICIALLATLGYLRILWKRKKRREDMVNRLRDARLLEKKSDQGLK